MRFSIPAFGQADQRKLSGSEWKVPQVHRDGKLERVDDFVFTTAVGTPFYGTNVTAYSHSILKHAGIPQHRFHDLRHTAATLLAVQGVHPKAIQGVLGWDQASMADRYTHFVAEMQKQAAEQMDAILKPSAVNLAVRQAGEKRN